MTRNRTRIGNRYPIYIRHLHFKFTVALYLHSNNFPSIAYTHIAFCKKDDATSSLININNFSHSTTVYHNFSFSLFIFLTCCNFKRKDRTAQSSPCILLANPTFILIRNHHLIRDIRFHFHMNSTALLTDLKSVGSKGQGIFLLLSDHYSLHQLSDLNSQHHIPVIITFISLHIYLYRNITSLSACLRYSTPTTTIYGIRDINSPIFIRRKMKRLIASIRTKVHSILKINFTTCSWKNFRSHFTFGTCC